MPALPDAISQLGYHPLARRDTPKLNGSSAAFVALVIVLAVIIIVACSAAIYLLWDGNNRSDRRSRIRRYQATGIEAAAAESSFVARVGRLFQFRRISSASGPASPNTPVPQKKSIKGWIQNVERATSRDVLATVKEENEDPSKEEASVVTSRDYGNNMSQVVTPSGVSAVSVMDTSQRGYLHPVPTLARERTSSMLSDGSMMTVSYVSSLTRHPSIVAPGPLRHQHSIPTIVEPESEAEQLLSDSSSSSPPPRTAPHPSSSTSDFASDSQDYPNGKGRPFATRSGTSITLDGGSKFVETFS